MQIWVEGVGEVGESLVLGNGMAADRDSQAARGSEPVGGRKTPRGLAVEKGKSGVEGILNKSPSALKNVWAVILLIIVHPHTPKHLRGSRVVEWDCLLR
jgi:hypothetical protein